MMELAAGRDRPARAPCPGKTSTAHKPINGRFTNSYVAGFVGFAPVSAPRVIVAVMIDEPHGTGRKTLCNHPFRVGRQR
jgi:cell division protein FtsI (penicillin-binding protein 3)